MTIKDIGALRNADEGLNHQIIDTFATVSQADLAWTEKIWGSIAKMDGTLQVDFGLGKYHNRGVIDGFGGVSRADEQWTVRASRGLDSAPEEMSVGPVHYEIVEPLKRVRFRLEPNDIQPISFDVTLSGVTPPFFEERNISRNKRTGRIEGDVVRYHQGGLATGTITVDGETHDVTSREWFGYRDHSWGVRQTVGEQPRDLPPTYPELPEGFSIKSGMKWSPMFLARPDGTYYETAIFLVEGVWDYASAYVNEADGSQAPVHRIEPRFTYDATTRYPTGGELHLTMDSGEERVIVVDVLASGFRLRTAGYGEWAGHRHGSWQGPLRVDGEYIADCAAEDMLPQLGQLRDIVIRVSEGSEDDKATGYGILESVMWGEWPEFGLTEESDFEPPFL